MRKLVLILAFLLVGCNNIDVPAGACKVSECPNITVRFSPKGGVAQAISDNILHAQTDVYVQAFSFTSIPISNALIEMKKAGKTVVVILDKENVKDNRSVLASLYSNGVPVYIDDKHAIAHNKIVIIDRHIVFTGSYNFSNAAENSNAENSIEIADGNIAQQYLTNWQVHQEHSYLYVAK